MVAMPRLSDSDSRKVGALIDALGHLELRNPRCLPWFLEELAGVVGAAGAISVELAVAHSGLQLRRSHVVGGNEHVFRKGAERAIADQPVKWTNWNPIRPAPKERNRAISVVETLGWGRLKSAPIYSCAIRPAGFADCDQLRTLVCDGSSLLAWVGALRPHPFSARDRRLMQAVIPALRDRLLAEAQLDGAPLLQAALGAAMEEIPAAAFVLRHTGDVAYANAAGRALLDTQAHATRDALRDRVQHRSHTQQISITSISAQGLPRHYLAVRFASPPALARAATLAQRWGLTIRQREVLVLLARGHANKTIATTLGLAENTVELHVTALLSKAGVENRAMLVARFWVDLD